MRKLKTTKLRFYTAALIRSLAPEFWLRSDMQRTLNYLERYDQQDIERRLDYYHPVGTAFSPTDKARNHRTFDRTGINSTYFYDFKEFLRYFDSTLRFDYRFGDNTINPEYPAFVKSRPILVDGQNGILFKLNKLRHFYFVGNDIPFEKKKEYRGISRGLQKTPSSSICRELCRIAQYRYWRYPTGAQRANRLETLYVYKSAVAE